MLLIQMNTWLGPSRDQQYKERIGTAKNVIEVKEHLESFATNLPLEKALKRIRNYQEVFNNSFSVTAINFTLLGIQQIPDIEVKYLNEFNVSCVENLQQKKEDFD